MITGDFETRSACDLKTAGTYVYSRHETTQVLCFAFLLPDMTGDDVGLWHRATPGIEQTPWNDPAFRELRRRIELGELIEAHNSAMERRTWEFTWRRELPELPPVRFEQWRCSAAKASNFSLPRSLGEACAAMGLRHQKDDAGHRLMLKLCKPRKPKKAELKQWLAERGDEPMPLLWYEDPEEIRRNWQYCKQDVRAEHALSASLRDMSPTELAYWQMDQRMNDRGIACDVPGVRRALRLMGEATVLLNEELCDLTGGDVEKGSSRIKLRQWVNDRGVAIPDTKAETVEAFCELPDLEPRARRVLEICRDVNRTSSSKYKQMLKQVAEDGRLRDLMVYYGANRTGRWAGKGVQPHNFLRGFAGAQMEEVWADIQGLEVDELGFLWGTAMEALAKAVRGALVASPGKDLMVGDFAAIEARDILWLAGDEAGLEIFRRGEDVYADMASAIYKRPINKKDDPKERQFGKVCILGLGFGMGPDKFEDECVKQGVVGLEREMLETAVRVYRKEKYPLVPSLWKDYEAGAVAAVRERGSTVETGRVRWGVRGKFLHCRLPSGRLLSYFKPAIRIMLSYQFNAADAEGRKRRLNVSVSPKQLSPGRYALQKALEQCRAKGLRLNQTEQPGVFEKEVLTYWGVDPFTKRWGVVETYGGKLVENVTQATARDQMAESMLRADVGSDYEVLLSVHDELVTEILEGRGDVEEFEHMMAIPPDWCPDCPIGVEAWRGKRYRK